MKISGTGRAHLSALREVGGGFCLAAGDAL